MTETAKELKFYLGLILAIVLFSLVIADSVMVMLGIEQDYDTFFTLEPEEILVSLTLTPVLEEIFFRTHLSYQKKHFFGVLLMAVASGLLFYSVSTVVSIVFGLLFLLILLFYDKAVEMILGNGQKVTFIATAVLFSLIHHAYLTGYDFSVATKLSILLLNYLPIGLFLGHIRYKLGLVHSIIGHSIYNTLILTGNTIVLHI